MKIKNFLCCKYVRSVSNSRRLKSLKGGCKILLHFEFKCLKGTLGNLL